MGGALLRTSLLLMIACLLFSACKAKNSGGTAPAAANQNNTDSGTDTVPDCSLAKLALASPSVKAELLRANVPTVTLADEIAGQRQLLITSDWPVPDNPDYFPDFARFLICPSGVFPTAAEISVAERAMTTYTPGQTSYSKSPLGIGQRGNTCGCQMVDSGAWQEFVTIDACLTGAITVSAAACVIPKRALTSARCGGFQDVVLNFQQINARNPRAVEIQHEMFDNQAMRKRIMMHLATLADKALDATKKPGFRYPDDAQQRQSLDSAVSLANSLSTDPYLLASIMADKDRFVNLMVLGANLDADTEAAGGAQLAAGTTNAKGSVITGPDGKPCTVVTPTKTGSDIAGALGDFLGVGKKPAIPTPTLPSTDLETGGGGGDAGSAVESSTDTGIDPYDNEESEGTETKEGRQKSKFAHSALVVGIIGGTLAALGVFWLIKWSNFLPGRKFESEHTVHRRKEYFEKVASANAKPGSPFSGDHPHIQFKREGGVLKARTRSSGGLIGATHGSWHTAGEIGTQGTFKEYMKANPIEEAFHYRRGDFFGDGMARKIGGVLALIVGVSLLSMVASGKVFLAAGTSPYQPIIDFIHEAKKLGADIQDLQDRYDSLTHELSTIDATIVE